MKSEKPDTSKNVPGDCKTIVVSPSRTRTRYIVSKVLYHNIILISCVLFVINLLMAYYVITNTQLNAEDERMRQKNKTIISIREKQMRKVYDRLDKIEKQERIDNINR